MDLSSWKVEVLESGDNPLDNLFTRERAGRFGKLRLTTAEKWITYTYSADNTVTDIDYDGFELSEEQYWALAQSLIKVAQSNIKKMWSITD